MSILSFADVAVFFFIVIRGVFRDFEVLLITTFRYFKFSHQIADEKDSLKCSVKDYDDEKHYENEELDRNQEIENIYVSTILNYQ